MEIKYYQRHSDQLFIPTSAFARLCRELADNFARQDSRYFPANATMYTMPGDAFIGRFSKEALLVLQLATEKYMTDFFSMRYVERNKSNKAVRNVHSIERLKQLYQKIFIWLSFLWIH